jgi:hypothetical protein
MGRRVMDDVVYTLNGEAADIETIARLRTWMEDEVRSERGEFSKTKLYTDYIQEREIFEFKIVFYK